MTGSVIAVSRDAGHRFAKRPVAAIMLVAGLGVADDAHFGATVQHRSRLLSTPSAPNLRQVHLIHAELFGELRQAGFSVEPGDLGENVTTVGVDLLAMGMGTQLKLGSQAVVELTGLRNPCRQIDENIGSGAMVATLAQAGDGSLVRKAGVMAVVIAGGDVRSGDIVAIHHMPDAHVPLMPV